MDSGVIVAIIACIASVISSAGTLTGVIISNRTSHTKTLFEIQSVKENLAELQDKVEQHNKYDRRIVALETKVDIIERRND